MTTSPVLPPAETIPSASAAVDQPWREHRQAGLDGLRAFAVLAVIGFHGGVPGFNGGLLGVDIFFVLSGFLITTLLCREVVSRQGVRLGRFWAQRVRRLLPGLLLLLLGVALFAWVFRDSADLGSIRADTLSSLGYVANWRFIFSSQGYFAQGAAPSPVLHTWSLAVEEQYYLIWPLVVVAVVRIWGVARVTWVAMAGALASAGWMLFLALDGVGVDRLYYGTDTRAQALLVGSALGAWRFRRRFEGSTSAGFVIVPPERVATRRQRRLWTLPGVVGALALLVAVHELAGTDPRLYRGGFLVVALATAGVILTIVTVPSSWIGRVCAFWPLVGIGRISYGLYLYHWPIFLALDNAHTGWSGWPLLALRLSVTGAVAYLSFRFVEEPIRTHAAARGHRGFVLAVASVVLGLVVLLVATVPVAATSVSTTTDRGQSASERAALTAVEGYSRHPVSFAVVGDSVALTLGVGLGVHSVPRYGVYLYNGGELGCDLDNGTIQVQGVAEPSDPICAGWPRLWENFVVAVHADVVGVLLARWVLADHLVGGRWVHVGQPAWDGHLRSELERAVKVLSAHGATVVFFTAPLSDPSTETPSGGIFPENEPGRVAAFNALLEQVASRHPGTVRVIDLEHIVDPSGHYQRNVDGVTVRWADGIHFAQTGGEWLQPQLLPALTSWGLAARNRSPYLESHELSCLSKAQLSLHLLRPRCIS